jgi:hypothetical protein
LDNVLEVRKSKFTLGFIIMCSSLRLEAISWDALWQKWVKTELREIFKFFQLFLLARLLSLLDKLGMKYQCITS